MDSKTTIGEIAELLFREIREEVTNDLIKRSEIDNVIKYVITNTDIGQGEVEVKLTFKINDKSYQFVDVWSAGKKRYCIGEVFVTQIIIEDMKSKFYLILGDIMTNIA
jgi:hypothetical protein